MSSIYEQDLANPIPSFIFVDHKYTDGDHRTWIQLRRKRYNCLDEVFFNKASSAYKVCARGEDPSCAASVVVASGVDDHASYMGESFAAKHLECALAPSTPKALEAAAKALAA